MDLAFKILIPELFKSQRDGKAFLELLLQSFPSHVPEKYGSEEPLKKKFSAKNLGSVLDDWGKLSFTAERKNPSLWFSVWFAMESVPVPRHSTVHVRLHAEDSGLIPAARNFLVTAALTFGADLAVGHILTKHEFTSRIEDLKLQPGSNPAYMLQRAQDVGTAEALDGMTVLQFKPNVIKRGLPDLCWLTVFGPPYVELFGRERLLSAPATEVAELSNGSILIRLSDSLDDDQRAWDSFQAVKSECKHHLNSDAFAIPGARMHHCRIPAFRFPIEMYKPQTTS